MAVVPTENDKAKISHRIDRFGKQGGMDGNKNTKKKISIDDMLKTVSFSPVIIMVHRGCIIIYLFISRLLAVMI